MITTTLGTKYAIEWKSSVDEIPDLLWSKCFPEPLEAKWWYQSLEKAGLSDQFTFYYLLILKNDEAVGIAPVFKMDVPVDMIAPDAVAAIVRGLGRLFPGVQYQRTLFVGSPCAEEGTIGLSHSTSLQEVAPVLQDELEKQARLMKVQMIVWKDFPEESSSALKNLCQSHKMFRIVSYPGTVAPLPQGNWDNYLASLSGPHRHNFKKKLKRGAKQGELETSIVHKPDDKQLAEIFDLFWLTYEKGKTKFEKLNIEFFRELAAQDQCYFVTMRAAGTGKLAAFMLCYRFPTRVVNKFIGLDYELGHEWFLYFRLWEQAVRFAMLNGSGELQSGQTGYRAKIDVGHKLVPLNNFCKNFAPPVNWVYATVGKTISWRTIDTDLETYLKAHPEEDKSHV